MTSLSELELMRAFMAEVPIAIPTARIFRRDIINEKSARGHWIKAGIKGQADTYILVRGGRHVELETKAAGGRLSDEQKAWRAFCLDFEIPYLMPRAKPGEHSATTIERWIGELRACLT